jgi:excisionase family DNA binding protein
MSTLSTQQKFETLKLLYGKREAAAALSLSVRTVENLIARKELVARRVGSRTLVVASSLFAFARKDHPSASPTARANRGEGSLGAAVAEGSVPAPGVEQR